MANVEHSTLTGAELHEPKGVAGALANKIYISDGAASGTWTYMPHGWAYYVDTAAAQNITTTASKLSINGLGAATNVDYLPPEIRGSGVLWNTTTDKITPMKIGDAYSVRIDLPVNAKTGLPTTLIFELDIGGGAAPTTVIVARDIAVTRTPPYTLSIAFPIFTLATFVTNGGQIFISTDTGTVDVLLPAITLVRTHGGDL
jgi:hypothetical protein